MALIDPTAELVIAIREALDRTTAVPAPERVADVLARFLPFPDLLAPAHRRADDRRYMQHVIHVDPQERFSLCALVWQPGQATRIHDHVAWCTVGIYEGIERETAFGEERCRTSGERRLHAVSTRDNAPGAVEGLSCGNDIHQVFNPGPHLAISLHVYGTNVRTRGSSVHRLYDEAPEAETWAI